MLNTQPGDIDEFQVVPDDTDLSVQTPYTLIFKPQNKVISGSTLAIIIPNEIDIVENQFSC